MANIAYHKLPNNEYMAVNAPGGPIYFKIAMGPDGQWYPQFTYNGDNWFLHSPFATQALAQTALDQFITSLNAGTVGP